MHEKAMPKAGEKPPFSLEAVIFDLDGVVTDTAEAHAAAWKRLFDEYLGQRAADTRNEFRPFSVGSDYRIYVDGKPRYNGARDFLKSRNIYLPFGTPGDDPKKETICGLGNRKNSYFSAWLDKHKVRAYPATVELLRRLRAAGIRTGLFTSSRNGEAVLENAGVKDLFDVEVDGIDLAVLNMPGKPDPSLLLETAKRLDVSPGQTAVVEDAISGVRAGRAGKFGLVIGISRQNEDEALSREGADLVVHDLAELIFHPKHGFAIKMLNALPSVWERKRELRDRLAGSTPAVFLDYDGTLTPIVEDFTKAFLAPSMRQAVDRLAQHCHVAIMSGRDLSNLRDLVGLDSVHYAGSDGFDIAGSGTIRETLDEGEAFQSDLDAAEDELVEALSSVEGHVVERRRSGISVHYRRVAGEDEERVEHVVNDVVEQHSNLRKGRGKKVFRIQPRLDWDKGRAADWLLDRFQMNGGRVRPVYVGDDLSDEDAFQTLTGRGIGVAVGDAVRPTSADYSLASPDEVRRFLDLLIAITSEEA